MRGKSRGVDALNTWELDLRILAASLDNLELSELSILAFTFCVANRIEYSADFSHFPTLLIRSFLYLFGFTVTDALILNADYIIV